MRFLSVLTCLVLFAQTLQGQKYFVYVASESEDEVALISFDGSEAKVEATIPVGYMPTEIEGPHGIAISPDGQFWYLTMAHGLPFGKLYKYRTADNSLVGQTDLGLFPATMQISKATGFLFAVNFNLHGKMEPSSVSVVDPESMTEITKITTGTMPHGSRISPDGLRHYSCAMMSGELFEISALDLKKRRVLSLEKEGFVGHGHSSKQSADKNITEKSASDEDPVHSEAKPTWVIPHPTDPTVYVAANGTNELLEIDVNKWEVSYRMPTGRGPYNVEVTPNGRKIIVTYKSEGKTAIWDATSREELAVITNSRKVSHGIAVSPDNRYAFVSVEGIGAEPGSVDIIDLDSQKLVAVAEVGKQAGGIAFWKMMDK